jgi:hypothetical protein
VARQAVAVSADVLFSLGRVDLVETGVNFPCKVKMSITSQREFFMSASPLPQSVSLEALGAPALRSFFALAEHWNLRIAEQRKLLGDPPESTFYKWKRQQDGALGRDVIERISYLLGIWKNLQILFPDTAQADAWLHRPNQARLFGGHSALQRMLSGNVADLYVVRQYLDAQRGVS